MGRFAFLVALTGIAIPLNGELLPIRAYTVADGLAADHVDCVLPDSRGFVWFCTAEGLTRFDGYRWVTFGPADGLPHQAVQALLETPAGEMLIGTREGLCRLLPGADGQKFAAYPLGADRAQNDVVSLREGPSGKIWCGTMDGLFELSGGLQFRRQAMPAPANGWERMVVTDILEDAGGRVWVSTVAGIYEIARDGATRRLGKADGLLNDWVNALLFDPSGRLWAATRGGLAVVDARRADRPCGVMRVYTRKDGLPSANVMALALAPDGAIWIATTVGISRLSPGSGPSQFHNFNRVNGLTDWQIEALATDKAGNMWAGTEGAGVMRIETAGFTTFREQDGLSSDRVWSVFTDQAGKVIAVTPSARSGITSLSVFDGAKFRAIAPAVFGSGATWGQHRIFLESRAGEWWGATKKGLCRYSAVKATGLAQKRPTACYAPDAEIFQIFEDSKGGIWASAQSKSGDRLIRWAPGTKAISRFKEIPTKHWLASAFAEDRAGNIWMGRYGNGDVFRYDGRQFTQFSRKEGVPRGTIFALLTDRAGRLWITSTDGGLGVIENPTRGPIHVRTYDTGSGLSSNTVTAVVEDTWGRIYAGTAKGVDRLNPLTGRVKQFSTADGLAHGVIKSAVRDGSGNLWFATTQGLSRLVPTADRPPTVPTILITGLRAGRARYPVSLAGQSRILRGELQPAEGQLQVQFAGFNNEQEENLRYSYKLEGGESEWHALTRDHEVNYPGLTPGRYRFLVKAVNSEGAESTAPAEVDFSILPPLWRRWWFETLALAGLAAMILAAHRYRVAQAVQIERMRTAISTDLHDDIGASLSQIAILSEVARTDAELGATGLHDRLDRIATLARDLVESMSDIVWSIRVEPDSVDSLIRRMREFANDLLESQAIRFRLRGPEPETHTQLSLQARRQILLIFKECIHNAARHSGCTEVAAELNITGREIVLQVRDNGRGLRSASGGRRSGGSGISNMRRRAANMGGSLDWDALPDEGCTVKVSLPLRRGALHQPPR